MDAYTGSGQNKVTVWLTYKKHATVIAFSFRVRLFLIVSAFEYNACGVNCQSFFFAIVKIHSEKSENGDHPLPKTMHPYGYIDQ